MGSFLFVSGISKCYLAHFDFARQKSSRTCILRPSSSDYLYQMVLEYTETRQMDDQNLGPQGFLMSLNSL